MTSAATARGGQLQTGRESTGRVALKLTELAARAFLDTNRRTLAALGHRAVDKIKAIQRRVLIQAHLKVGPSRIGPEVDGPPLDIRHGTPTVSSTSSGGPSTSGPIRLGPTLRCACMRTRR